MVKHAQTLANRVAVENVLRTAVGRGSGYSSDGLIDALSRALGGNAARW